METCKIHGDYVRRSVKTVGDRIIIHPCPDCGADKIKKSKEFWSGQQDYVATKTSDDRLGSSGIPEKYTWEIEEYEEAHQTACKTFLSGTGWRSLLLLGHIGRYKTSIACAILREACKATTGMYVTMREMSSRITLNRKPEPYSDCGLLVIDEINRSYKDSDDKPTQADLDKLFDVINKRCDNKLPIIIVGNIEASQLKYYVGPAITDRLQDGGVLLEFKGESLRNKGEIE